MDKRDHDAILNAYNVAKEQLARKKNDADSAADALQESIVGVIKARARVKNLTGYALRAAHREFKRLINLERRSEQTAEKEIESHPDVGWEDRVNDRLLIRQLLSKLEARDQILLRLYSEDYPWKYIGPIVGLTPQSAKQTCYLLLRQLRQTARDEAEGVAGRSPHEARLRTMSESSTKQSKDNPFSRKEEREIREALRQTYATEFPNPKREGCPDKPKLRALARRETFPALKEVVSHVSHCSPCSQELTELIRQHKSRQWFYRAAAVALIVVGMAAWASWAPMRNRGTHVPQPLT